ncbi:MAG: tetratricopeptide repeat protein [Helicobacteraceae bacterium]|jgi:tetratricopeptide (TPR) repeat protein|nr:tetratricopeptide repeat protein [Helicobacteraceae bacterium]
MKQFFGVILPLVVSSLYALDITQTTGIIDKESYLALTLKEDRPFSCRVNPATLLEAGNMVCEFDRVPALKPQPIDNPFFSVEPILDPKRFTIKIAFKQNALVYPMETPTLSSIPIAPNGEITSSSRWIAIGYKNKPPVLRASSGGGLNFPVVFPPFEPPSVGALDLNGAPIANRAISEDGQEFSRILAQYEAGFLTDAQRMIDDALARSDGKHLFMPELLALKIKILDKLGDQDEALIAAAKPWTEAYAFHKETPEILLLLANAQTRLGLIADGRYHYDTLIREYPKNPLSDFARIYKADRAMIEGKAFDAKLGYESVLFNSQDVSAAALAASRLADMAIREDDIPKAAEFYEKILKSAPEFFLDKLDESERLMNLMAEQKLYVPAALLGEIVLEHIDSTSQTYENSLLSLARWQNFAHMSEKSLITYERYLAEFDFSPQAPLARKERDLLEFSIGRQTQEANLALYDEIITKYPDDEAADRALYEKSKLLVRLGRYAEASEILPKLDKLDKALFHNFDAQMRQMERSLLDAFLQAGDCAAAARFSRDRRLGVSIRSDEAYFDCAYKARDFNLALEIAQTNIRKYSPAKGAKWSARRLDTLYAMADYPSYIDGEERYIKMLRALKEPIGADRYIRLFDSYRRTGFEPKRMGEIAAIVESQFPKEPRLMDIYAAMIVLSADQNDSKSQYDYSKKLVNRTRLTAVKAFTPEAEMAFARAALKEGKPNEAILVLQTLLNEALDIRDRSKALFTLGEALEQNASVDLAATAFQRCANLEINDDPWSNLCREKIAAR